MARNPVDAFVPPLVSAILTAAVAASALITRTPEPAPTQVLGIQVQQPPAVEAAAPPLPTIEPTPVPTSAPRIVAPRPPRARTSGPPHSAPRSINAWIQLPTIGVSAPVVAVGLDQNGNMVTPRNAKDVAWLDNGTFPGPTRNAVMAGHRNWSGRAGSFERLERLQQGDVVKVGVDGKVYTFAVSWVRQYDPNSAPVEEIMGDAPVDSVTLVTCGGPFNSRTRHYTMRWVARAELVDVV